MNIQRALIIAGISSVALATPAMAQDSSTFTGPRIEGIVGYDNTRSGSEPDADFDRSIDGLAYGVGIGYDLALGGVVLGVEAEWLETDAKTSYDISGATTFDVAKADMGREIYVGLRAGVPVTPSTLLYAKVGYANARANVLVSDNTTDVDLKTHLDGWRVGAGVERAFGPNFYGKLEYRYANYDEGKFEFANGATTERFDTDFDRHQVLVGVGYRF